MRHLAVTVGLLSAFVLSFLLVTPALAALPQVVQSDTTEVEEEQAANENRNGRLSVYVDCDTRRCDFDYFRREISFVNYVRNRQDADVHVLITSQSAGTGQRYELEFIGLRGFANEDEMLTFTSSQTDTDDEIREGLTRTLALGLVRYAAHTPVANRIDISHDGEAEDLNGEAQEDPWNFWVFRTSLNSSVSGEQRRRSFSVRPSFSANRTTRDWKLDFGLSGHYRHRIYELDDDETVIDIRRDADFGSLIVRSIDDHWSIGGFGSAERSTFDNYDLAVRLAPAIEYNYFPYNESSRRQLRLLYRPAIRYFDYSEMTIFEETEETLLHHGLEITLDIRQPWGSVRVSVEGSHFLHDLTKQRLDGYSRLDLNVFRGLSLDLRASASLIRDQLNLAAGDADPEDILLERRQLATGYDFFASVGVSYTFGSTDNNVVNPRF